MELNSVQFLRNKTILVTGASGFLAKVFLEKILRAQPNVKKLYLLLRAPDYETAMQRLRNEVKKDLFRVLRTNLGDENLNSLIANKVAPVPGDISMDNLGVNDYNIMQEMCTHIDIVVNVAATTSFDERYDTALETNAFGALNVLSFTKKCIKPQLLLHVSTAYVCGERSGLLLEEPFIMGETLNGDGKLDINVELELTKQKLEELQEQDCTEEEITRSMKDLGMKRAKLHGWPNTYVFTKAMGEMLLGHYRGNVPLVIIRPTMITSTLKQPFPGWIEGLRTVDGVIAAYGKGNLKCFLADPNSVCDLIPVDMVVNAMVEAIARHMGESGVEMVYHVGSSAKNPLTFGQMHEFVAQYFTKNPLLDLNHSPIVVSNLKLLPNMTWFNLYLTLCYKLPLQLLRLVSIINPWRYGNVYQKLDRRIKLVTRLVELYKPYVLFKGIFDDINTEKLRMERKKYGKELHGLPDFDPKCIDWEDYLINTHILGLVTYVLKA